MTGFKIEQFPFDAASKNAWAAAQGKSANWPVVYTLSGRKQVYVGETLNMAARAHQHLQTDKQQLAKAHVIVDDEFNKSACLDLESHLIRLFSGDGALEVLNRNDGVLDADYFDRERYQSRFKSIFEELRSRGLFSRTLPEIINSDLFKLSPFKALNQDQAIAVEGILHAFFGDLASSATGVPYVVRGAPGTGKTIIAIYLMKLLTDIHQRRDYVDESQDALFTEFFDAEHAALLGEGHFGFVIPQQSLRASVKKVFKRTPGLRSDMVLSPFEVGTSKLTFDLLVVDEAHRLTHRANQPSAAQNKNFKEINEQLFDTDDFEFTQLDWIKVKSRHQILMVDENQSVRPADLPPALTHTLVKDALAAERLFNLATQMRLRSGEDFTSYIKALLRGTSTEPRRFQDYDLAFFDHFPDMRDAIRRHEREVGLCRLVAGYAWEWKTKKDPNAIDIELDGVGLRWNSKPKDWISSKRSAEEVGSIHTVQGYDLNWVGVIIGPELSYNPEQNRIIFRREFYADKKGMENNLRRNLKYTDDDIREYVLNVYFVLLTRGIYGCYVYVCDPALREHLRKYFDPRGVVDVVYPTITVDTLSPGGALPMLEDAPVASPAEI